MTNLLHHLRKEAELYVNTQYKILFEDEWMMAVEKPAPLPVHPVGRFKEKTLLTLLQKNTQLPSDTNLRIVNRLDSETSGVLIVAKSAEAAGNLGFQFMRRGVEKEYLAIVLGSPAEKEGVIRFNLGTKVDNNFHVRTNDPNGETAETFYRVLQEIDGYSLLSVVPLTGRTHQIRAHLALSGHPLVGDKIYIDPAIFERYIREGWQEEMRKTVKMPRLALHATRLKIRHPQDGRLLEFTSPMPRMFQQFLSDPAFHIQLYQYQDNELLENLRPAEESIP